MTPQAWSFAAGGGWWSGLLLEATLKGTLCLAVAALAALALRRRSAAQRHLAWTAGIVSVLVLPLLLVALPDWPIPVGGEWVPRSLASAGLVHVDGRPGAAPARALPASSPGATDAASVLPRPHGERSASRPLDGESWRLGLTSSLVWLAGAVAVLLPLLVASRRLAGIARRGAPLDGDRWRALCEELAPGQGVDAQGLRLIRAGEPVGPLTWGIFRPVVILPPGCDGWSDAQARAVLVHELCHLRRRDCLTQVLASAACVLHWFNPLVWLAARQMLTERERACDDRVLLSGARASDYANDLLDLARSLGAPWSTSRVTTAMARRSQIAERLLAVLDPHLERKGAGRRSVVFGAALTLGALLPLASATLAVPPAPPAEQMPATASSSPQPTSSAAVPAANALDLDKVRRELRAQERAFAEVLALADVDALAQFYTEDAQVALPFFPVTYGRQGVRGVWRHLVDNGARGVDIETWEVYAVGDLVCEVGQAYLRDSSGRRTATGRFMTLWKKEGGIWRMHRDSNLAREGGS